MILEVIFKMEKKSKPPFSFFIFFKFLALGKSLLMVKEPGWGHLISPTPM